VPSARAIKRATRVKLESRFFNEWCRRAPFLAFDRRFLNAVERLTAWPSPEQYDHLAAQVPRARTEDRGARAPRFITQDAETLERCGGYEQHVAQTGAVPTRAQSWHDFFNMAVWAHFPRLRWALNAIHVDRELGPLDPRNGRAPQQNVAAQLDESGLIVAGAAPDLLSELAALRFKRVFWERREELLATTRFWIVGHGLLESLLAPHLGLSSKAILLELPRLPASYAVGELRQYIDAEVARRIHAWRQTAPMIHPVPILGIPGYADNVAPEFYDDARYFRCQRRPRER
jgi:hypothetical protein